MAAPLTHETIKDGWFHEKTTLWPGQGMFCSKGNLNWNKRA